MNYITIGPAESDVTISWNLLETSTLPVSGLFLIDLSSGAHVNMREASSYTFHAVVPDGQGSAMYSFEITTEMCFDLQLKQGWNLISLPLDPGVSTPAEVLAGTNYMSIWTWDAALKRYVLPEQMVPGRGYWVLVPADTTLSLCGVPVSEYSADVPAGWSLIGSIVQTGGVSTVPPDVTQATLYAWDPVLKKYVSATVVEPGKGYWLLAFQPCTVTVAAVP